jgi:hypothetical protein
MRYTTEVFKKKIKKIHGEKYILDKIEYVGNREKVCVICPKHGEFWIRADSLLEGKGCKLCGIENKKITREEFIRRAAKIHDNKYDYSKVVYKNYHSKVCIICPIHGEFWQTPANHLNGKGCDKCAHSELWDKRGRKTTEEFIKEAKQIHGDKYDYSKVIYINNSTKICIICPIHGEFWQTPANHLNGCGCPKCKESSLEREMRIILEKNNIDYWQGEHFNWLGKQHLDFYLPKYNVAIECQGGQHFMPVNRFGGNEKFKIILERDLKKYNLCKKNEIKLYYYTSSEYKKYENEYSHYKNNLYNNVVLLINEIKRIG